MNHPVETAFLPRLKGVRKAPATSKTRAAWRAACPLHSSSNLNLSIAIAIDDAPLLYCHCRHQVDEVLAEVGLNWIDLYPQPTFKLSASTPGRSNGGPSVWVSLAGAVDGLLQAHTRLLSHARVGELAEGLEAMVEAVRAGELVKQIARRAMRERK